MSATYYISFKNSDTIKFNFIIIYFVIYHLHNISFFCVAGFISPWHVGRRKTLSTKNESHSMYLKMSDHLAEKLFRQRLLLPQVQYFIMLFFFADDEYTQRKWAFSKPARTPTTPATTTPYCNYSFSNPTYLHRGPHSPTTSTTSTSLWRSSTNYNRQ